MAGERAETPREAVDRGLRLGKEGDVPGARAAFQRAIDSGDYEEAPIAAIELGVLLYGQKDKEGTRDAYRKAVEFGHQKWASHASNNLGVLLGEMGDIPGARAAHQKAIDLGHVEYVPRSANNLGILLENQGDVPGARAAYQKAIDSGHSLYASLGARNLGLLSEKQSDVAGARSAYQKAIDLGHVDHAPTAAVSLATFLHNLGDVAGAYVAYHYAIESGHVDRSQAALYNLGLLHQYRRNDPAAARTAYEKVVRSNHQSWVSKAQEKLTALDAAEAKDGAGASGGTAGSRTAGSLTADMTKDDVRRALGPPSRSWRFRHLGGDVSALRRHDAILDREYWLYEDTPTGHKTYVVMSADGVLQEDATVTSGATSDQLGPPAKDGRQADVTYPAPAGFTERTLPGGGCWRPTEYEVRFYRSLAVPDPAAATARPALRFESCRAVMEYLVTCVEDESGRSGERLRQGALYDLVTRDWTDLRTLPVDVTHPVEVVDQYYYDAVEIVDAVRRV